MREYSYGVIPLKYTAEQKWEVLLIKHHAGHWSFPKGHANAGESPQQTAARELEEETGLVVERYLSNQPLIENYVFFFQKKKVFKTVAYFIAQVNGDICLQAKEVCDCRWVPIHQAADLITFKEGKEVCSKVIDLLNN